MKKMLLAVLAAGLMSTSAFALYVEGTVVGVNPKDNNTVIISIKRSSDGVIYHRYMATYIAGDNRKELLAVAMTAFASGLNVVGTGPAGDWTAIQLKDF